MTETIVAVIITGGLSLVGTIITVLASSRKTEENMRVEQAITRTELKSLTEQVKKHNDFATRMPVVEAKLENLTDRVDDLERKVG